MKQTIEVTANATYMMKLPCVYSCHKENGELVYLLYDWDDDRQYTKVHIGDWLGEDEKGKWHVLDNPTEEQQVNNAKRKPMNKELLKKNFENACNAYTMELCLQWDIDNRNCWWVADEVGGVWEYDGDVHLNMDEIIYIVENDITIGEVYEWQDYCTKAHEYGFNLLNLNAWHKGAPRIPQETFNKLDNLKGSLNEEIEKVKKGQE